MPLNINQVQTFLHSLTVDVNCVSNVLCLAVIAIGSFFCCVVFPLFTIQFPFCFVWFSLPLPSFQLIVSLCSFVPFFYLFLAFLATIRAYPLVFISFTLATENYSPLPSENKPKIHSPPLLKLIELTAPVITVLTHESNPSHLHTLTHSRKKSIKRRRDVTQLSNC